MKFPSVYRAPINMIAMLMMSLTAVIDLQGEAVKENSLDQPIAFNHQKHIQNNVKCITCHEYYNDYTTAGMPGVAVCTKCHEDVIYITLEKEKIQKYVKAGEEIPWKQVYSIPGYVYFSHKRHVAFGKIDCVDCHGNVAGWTTPPTEPEVNLDMNTCIQCHQTMKEQTQMADVYNCNRCHR